MNDPERPVLEDPIENLNGQIGHQSAEQRQALAALSDQRENGRAPTKLGAFAVHFTTALQVFAHSPYFG